jgi:hypothetical protein
LSFYVLLGEPNVVLWSTGFFLILPVAVLHAGLPPAIALLIRILTSKTLAYTRDLPIFVVFHASVFWDHDLIQKELEPLFPAGHRIGSIHRLQLQSGLYHQGFPCMSSPAALFFSELIPQILRLQIDLGQLPLPGGSFSLLSNRFFCSSW